MQYIVLLIVSIVIGGYFAFRYFSLVCALRKIRKDLEEIRHDLTQNQMVHSPAPNRHLNELLCSLNAVLEGIRKERLQYEKREKTFQKQIENISHDLRTPLTVILGYLRLFEKSQAARIESDSELAETIHIIGRKADAMKNLVTQFYDYARLNAGDYKLALANADVCRILKESVMGNYQILEQSHLKLELFIPDHPIWVLGDEAALERIFFNLLQNAGRYADSFFKITVKERPERTSILFENDTAILSEDDVPFLFDRFYTQDHSRSQEGSGLGLTVAKSLAEEMGGTLRVEVLKKGKQADSGNIVICFELVWQR